MAQELLIEVGTEEIPARFSPPALAQMRAIMEEKLGARRVKHGPVQTMCTPRRLVICVQEVSENQEEHLIKAVGPPAKVAYDQDVVASGPTYKDLRIDGNKVVISYDNLGSGFYLKNKYGYVNGFALAGKDSVFHWAKAEILGNKIVVSSNVVDNPIAVRYGWANNPDDLNLYNLEGLPAVPFRTDNWPGITQNNTYR